MKKQKAKEKKLLQKVACLELFCSKSQSGRGPSPSPSSYSTSSGLRLQKTTTMKSSHSTAATLIKDHLGDRTWCASNQRSGPNGGHIPDNDRLFEGQSINSVSSSSSSSAAKKYLPHHQKHSTRRTIHHSTVKLSFINVLCCIIATIIIASLTSSPVHHHLSPSLFALAQQQPSLSLSSQSASQAAIVRRLYYSSPNRTSTPTSPHRSTTYSSSSASSSPKSSSSSPPLLHSRGIAKVTPISLQSTTYVRLNQQIPKPGPNGSSSTLQSSSSYHHLPIATVSAMIPVVSLPTSDPSSKSVIDNVTSSVNVSPTTPPTSSAVVVTTPPSVLLTSTLKPNSNTSTSSSRQAKALDLRKTPLLPLSSVINSTKVSPPTSAQTEVTEESNLCFLSHGGSSETFTVNEAMPIDSVIGTIKVIGNASAIGGNIELSIIGPSDSSIFTSKSSTTFTSYYPTNSGFGSSSSSSSSSTQNPTETNEAFARRSDSNDSSNPLPSTTTPEPEPQIPIRIDPGTKKLVLSRKLDKESIEGESGITIGVRCRPRKAKKSITKSKKPVGDDRLEHQTDNILDQDQESSKLSKAISSNDPESSYWIYDTATNSAGSSSEDGDDDIIIPIRILVTDANDNRPEWQGATPYQVNISEMASVGSVVLSGIRAIDNDQLGPYSTVEYYVESGPYSHLLRFASPLEGTLVLASPLDYETLPKFWITIRAQDQGNPPNSATTKVEIRVQDADDQNPRFEMDKYTTTLADGQRPGDPLSIQPRSIKAEDPDKGIRSPIIYGFNSRDEEMNKENSYFKIDANSGEVSLRRPLPATIQLPLTLVIRATQLDNRDRYALTTLTILSRRNQIMPELRFLHTNYSTSLLESTPPGHVVLTVQTSRVADSGSSSTTQLRFQILDDDEGYFSVRNSGEILVKKQLDYEKHKLYSFRTMVTDGRQSDVARVTVEVLNVNEHDPIFAQPSYQFHINEARLRSSPVIGTIQASDADDGDKVQITLSGPHASAFALSASDGTLRLRSLRLVNSSECHMIATATDSGTPPRSSSASVVVKFSSQLLKSFNGRTLSGDPGSPGFFFTDWEEDDGSNDLDRASSSSSPSAADILTHGASNLFNASANSTALVLVIVLGVLLGTLFIIIVALTLHVLKNRKYEGRSGSPGATASLHHPVTGSLVGSSAASTTSSSSSSSSSSNLSINSASGRGDGHYAEHHHHHHVHHGQHRAHQYHQGTGAKPSQPNSAKTGNGIARNSQLFFSGLRLGSAKVSPTELTTTSPSPDHYDHLHPHDHDTHDYLGHAHHHHHHHIHDPHEHQKYTRKTFMDSEQLESSHKLALQNSNEMDSAISSDLSTSSDLASSGGRPHNEQHSQSNVHDHTQSAPSAGDSSSSSRSSSADLVPKSKSTDSNQNAVSSPATVGSRISVIKWPQGSIPRRVKKLTWQDEQRNNNLDLLYTSNSTVSAPNNITTTAKTPKTLSGHLLTGVTSAPPPSSQLTTYSLSKPQPPAVAPKPNTTTTKSFGQFMPRVDNSGGGGAAPDAENNLHYHHHQGSHHHIYSHPHVPNHSIHAQNPNNTTPNSAALPDLTVYF